MIRMKIRILTILAILMCALSSNAQLVAWNSSGISSWGTSPWAPTTTTANLAFGGLTRGSGVTTSGTAASNAWGGNGWAASSSAGISGNQFVTFTITANSGYTVSLSSFEQSYRRSSTGPSSGDLQYSINGGGYTTITTLSFSSTSSSGASTGSISLSGVSALQNVAAGSVISIRIVPYGATGATGTWYVNGSPSPNGLVINGTVSPVVAGCTTVTPGTISSSGGTSFCASGNPTLTLTGASSGTGIGYQWQSSTDSTTWSPISGATSTTYGPISISTTTYYRAVTTCSTSGAKDSASIGINVTPLPTASISGTTAVCSGGSSTITFTGTPNAIVTYTVNGGSNQTVTLDGTGSGTVSTGTITADAIYDLVSVSLNGCSQAQAGTATVTVNAIPTVAISGTTSICSGSSSNIIFTGTPNATVTYTLNGGGNLTVTLDGSGDASVSTGAITATVTYDLVSVSEGICSQVQTGTAVVSINALPTATISGTANICSGDNATISFTGTPNATITYNIDGGANLTVTLDGTGNATVNTGSITADATYNLVSVDDGTCTDVVTGSATITIDPLPVAVVTGTTTICDGGNTNITFTGTPNATVTYTINMGAPQTVVLDGAGSAVVNTGSLNTTTTYDLVSVNSGLCAAVLNGNAVVTVSPTPTATISGPASICSGNSANIIFTGTAFATITYTVNGGTPQSIVLDMAGNANVSTGILTANTTYSLTGASLNSCVGTPNSSVTIVVSPAPTATISGTTVLTPGNNTNINFSGTPGATVDYTVNNGPVQSVVLDGSGIAVVNTGVLYYDAVYDLVSVTLGCTQNVAGSATVTMTIAFGPIYTYTNDPSGAYDLVAANATGSNLTLSNGAVVSTMPCAAGFTTEGYDASASYDELTNKAVRIKVAPNDVLHRLIITGFSVGVRRSVDGPQYIRLAYSLDNGNSWINSGIDEAPNNSTCDDVTTYSWATLPFQVVSPANGILFSVFGFDAPTTAGQLQIINLVVNGAVIETPLPVTLTSFTGNCNSNTISFKWQVEKENNLTGYELEYSETGNSFSTVASQAVNPVNTNANSYSAILYDAAGGLYRLALNDMSGNKQYSNVLHVKCSGDVAASVLTAVNFSGSTLTVSMGSEFKPTDNVSIQVYSMNGQLISNRSNVSFSPLMKQELTLAQGVYLVRLVQGGVVSTHKVIVN
jgi:hypothetical protein